MLGHSWKVYKYTVRHCTHSSVKVMVIPLVTRARDVIDKTKLVITKSVISQVGNETNAFL